MVWLFYLWIIYLRQTYNLVSKEIIIESLAECVRMGMQRLQSSLVSEKTNHISNVLQKNSDFLVSLVNIRFWLHNENAITDTSIL